VCSIRKDFPIHVEEKLLEITYIVVNVIMSLIVYLVTNFFT